ncbi:MAG TPA: penicillin acylase family protein, partial [Acetobacteraceae bacterium]|nr:penicillin acylase family protein [Acetobacteraceae bacterium]
VYDLADLDRSRFVVAPGQSGDAFSPRSRDFLRLWRNGGTITLPPEPRRARATMILRPSRGR